jgi:hypothetical protein
MSENDRQQRMVERIQEDERLRGDLEDSAATALVNWASERAAKAAADPARPDDAVEAEVQMVRKAAQAAARSGESDPQRLLSLAEEALAGSAAPATGAAQPPAAAPPPPSASREEPAPSGPPASAPPAAIVTADQAAKPSVSPNEHPAYPPAVAPAAAAPGKSGQASSIPPAPQPPSRASTTEKVERPRATAGRRETQKSNLSDGQSRRKRQRLTSFLKRARGGR